DRSARELYDRAVPADLLARVHAAAAGAGVGVVRVVLTPDGVAAVTASPPPSAAPPTAFRTVRRDGVWRHKWADRSELSADEASGAPLYVAADGAVLETSRGNVFILLADGTLVTPPLRDDVLPGVTRRAVLDLARDTGGAVQLRTFPVDELCGSVAFWTSSLRGAVPIASVDGVLLPRCDDEVARVAARLFVS
ncbi:MAG: aminotransferase class IV, partial [Jatrophihabitans sp.]|uniref:aminotransferase class IV n=1 Tax=Jatrophihabitans sp. TaxID=1932789 RepID=UPI003F7DC661